MPLRIIHPRPGDKVPQDFTAFGFYEHPRDLVCTLVRPGNQVAVHLGITKSKQEGTWTATFHVRYGPWGEYTLVVTDPFRNVSKQVSIKVMKTTRARPVTSPTVTHPVSFDPGNPKTAFFVKDIAYGYAVVPPTAPDPVLTAEFIENNGAGAFNSGDGNTVDSPTAANGYYWSKQFDLLPTDKNPCRFHVTTDQHVNAADVDDVEVQAVPSTDTKALMKKRAPSAKKSNGTKKRPRKKAQRTR